MSRNIFKLVWSACHSDVEWIFAGVFLCIVCLRFVCSPDFRFHRYNSLCSFYQVS